MGATKIIMATRHGEEPGRYNGMQYDRGEQPRHPGGAGGAKHLVTRNWERAGALAALFTAPWGPKNSLAGDPALPVRL